ncbi:protein ARV1 [Ixodes scapularis]|uniref:protein ARV1 n=1 Tax=Ixodes scapularis TaxID=6945 RepID=UPI001A9D13F6|nr:protein ARV1 [Ixodes scapularis]
MKTSYVCIHCGEGQQQLYKRYGPDLLKLSRCSKCNHTVDEYIEMELSIVFIDAVLQKLEAYRHLIFNVGVERPWKLAVFFLLGEALELWMSRQQGAGAGLGLEWHFYLTCLFLVASNAVFLALVVALVNLCVKTCNREHLAWALVLCSYGKLLALPATLWGCDRSQAHLLVTAFFLCSQVQACRVVSGAGRSWAAAVVATSYLVQQAAVVWASPILRLSDYAGPRETD